MYVNLKYYLKNKLLDENSDVYLTKIYNEVFEKLTDEQKKLKKYLETKDDIDGFLNVGVLSKQKYFTPDNVNQVQQAFDEEINKIQNSDEYQKQIDKSIEIHSKRTTSSKIVRIFTKFPEAIERTGGGATIYLLFIPALVYTFAIAFQRDVTLYENLTKTIQRQKDRLSKAKGEYDKKEEEELQKWIEKKEKREKKQAIKEYQNSPEGRKQAILQKIQALNHSLAMCKKSTSRTAHEIDIPNIKKEIANLNSELLALQ
jgi:hypothetical protein